MPVHYKISCLMPLLCILPTFAQADVDTALTLGSGPNEYRSYAFQGGADLSDTVRFNLDHFLSKASGTDNLRQTGLGLSWQALEQVSVDYRHSVLDDGTVEVKGNEGGLTFELDPLWQGELRTALDLGYGNFKYSPAKTPLVGTGLFLTQTSTRFGLSQDLTSSFTLYGSHEQYKYDRDVVALAIFLITRTDNISKAASLLAFPDKTNTLGMAWQTTDEFTLDITASKTTTLLKQELVNTRIGMDYQLNDNLNIAAAITISSSSEKKNKSGVTVQKGTRETYQELTFGWAF